MFQISPVVVKVTHPGLPNQDFGVTLNSHNPTDEEWANCMDSLRRMIEKALDQKATEQ